MKKTILTISLIFVGTLSVYALSTKFTIDTTKLNLTNSKTNEVLKNFDDSYNLTEKLNTTDDEFTKQIKDLTKKTTYLLLGANNSKNESSEEYYKRFIDYKNIAYIPDIPKSDAFESGFDENSQEWKDQVYTTTLLPQIFNQLDQLKITYNTYGEITVAKSDEYVVSKIILPKVKLKTASDKNPKEFVYIENSLTLYYIFKEYKEEYKLYSVITQFNDELEDYNEEMANNENKSYMNLATNYQSTLENIYDFSKLKSISNDQIQNIYNNNIKNIVTLTSYYNNNPTLEANGVFINEGLIATTWSFIEESLMQSQYIAINDSNGEYLDFAGIVTANPETNIAILKLKDKISNKVTLGNTSELKITDPVFAISSKSGVGFTTQGAIVISNSNYLETSIPLTKKEQGAPIFDLNGQVIGMQTANQVNMSTSYAITSKILKEVQEKFNSVNFDEIKSLSFEELKEKYYYVKENEENIINEIPKSKWKKYSKIGDIENTITLKLVKANYDSGVVSLRYTNELSELFSNMQMAATFGEKLIEQGYKEKLSSSKKYIYENKDYRVIITSEFNYLIVVMVKL